MRHVDGTFVLTKADCKALVAFSCSDFTRVHLNCVRFEPADGWAAATDGHTLVQAQNGGRTEGAPGFSVPRADFEQATRLLRKKTAELVVEYTAEGAGGGIGTARMTARDAGAELGVVTARTPDAAFPPIDAVIPACDSEGQLGRKAGGVVGLNCEYLARLLLVQKAAGAIGCRLMPSGEELSPLVATCEDRTDHTTWTAVLMPLRI